MSTQTPEPVRGIANWHNTRLKFLTEKIGSGKTPLGGAESYVSQGVPLIRSQNVRFEGLSCDDLVFIDEATDLSMAGTRIHPGDVLLNITGASIGRSCIVPAGFSVGNVNQHVCIIRPRLEAVESRFLNAYLSSDLGQRYVFEGEQGISREGLSFEDIANFVVPTPPLGTQHRIADYVDQEAAKIDALIAEKERMLALLEEQRAAAVTHAVTRGLDPNVPLKPSGLEWLGEIPQHWRIEKLKFYLRQPLEQGWSPQCDNRPAEEDDWGVLKVGCVNGSEFDPHQQKALPVDVEPEVRYEIKKGDILLSRGNTIELVGSASLVPGVRPRLLLCDLLYRCRIDTNRIVPELVVHQLRSRVGRFQLEREASGTSGSMKKIGQETIANFFLFLPPIHEQRAIVAFIASRTRRIDSVAADTKDTISLLRERRSALITAAVTGQIPLEETQQ